MADLAAQAAADNVPAVAFQFAPKLGDVAANLDVVVNAILAEREAGLMVFPECALTGYIFENREDTRAAGVTIPGPEVDQILDACAQANLYACVGLIEIAGDNVFNSAVLAGPEGIVGVHRKAHLPRVGVDRYVDPGDIPFTVHQTTIGPIGMLICYDMSFPEAIRCLALDGMAILAHPTNSPTGTFGPPGSRTPQAKSDNNASRERVYIVSADRCGVEAGVEFTGGSRIAGPSGRVLARAESFGEEVVRAVLHPKRTISKRVFIEHLPLEVDYHGDRRPELYGRLISK